MPAEIDYEKEVFAEESDQPRETYSASSPSLAEDARAAEKERATAAAPNQNNDWREEARLELMRMHWIDSSGRKIPVRWTVGAKAYYEVLCAAAGLNRPEGGRPIVAQGITVYIFLWLATHDRSFWFRHYPEYGFALKDNPDLWLESILDWAGLEFPMGSDQFDREELAADVRRRVFELSYASRAEPMESPDPDTEEKPGN